jgi:hypothetical protein
MALPVYAWPPVGALGREWDHVQPISESFSALTGKRYASANMPERRVAQVVVSAMSNDYTGAGYCLMLKRLLAGGRNLVRLPSQRPFRRLNTIEFDESRGSVPLDWTTGGIDLLWTVSAIDLNWYNGTLVDGTVTTSGGFPALSCTGLPANRLVARPGEYITVYQNEVDTTGSTVQVMAPARTDGSGAVIIRLYDTPAYGGRVSIGVRTTAVFRAVGELPRTLWAADGDFTFGWQFEEVFADEVGGFTEASSWWRET